MASASGAPIGLLGARRLRELLRAHSFLPRKSLGQNFVIDPNTIRKMVGIAGVRRGDRVLEIGAGAGSLTLGLAAVGAHVVALEVDEVLVTILGTTVGHLPNVEIVQGDALSWDLAAADAATVVANLPYNVATAVVLRVLDEPRVSSVTVMAQREVGERLAASPGSKSYGQASVLVASRADAAVAARVSRRAFYPVPRVDSVIVHLVRKAGGPDVDPARYATVVKAAFAQRRKMLRQALIPVAGSREAAEDALERSGIAATARAEEVSWQGYVELTRALPGR